MKIYTNYMNTKANSRIFSRVLFTFFFLALGCFSLLSQSYFPPIVNYSTKDYGKNQTPENKCIVQDERGVIYVGNANNILEYDGINWRKIKVTEGAYITALALDSNGFVYAGSFSEIGYLKPDKKGALTFNSLVHLIPEENQMFSNIISIESDGEKMYFQCSEYIFIYDGKKIEVISTENTFHTAFYSRGRYFVRERNVGLCELKGNKLELIPGGENFADYAVFGILPRSEKGISSMVITYERGLWMYDESGIFQHPFANHDALNELEIMGGKRLSRGWYALFSYTTGLTIIDKDGNIKYRITRRNGLRVNEVINLFEDKNQNIWLALNNGIAKVNYTSPLSFFNERTGLLGNIQTFIRHQNEMYVGTSYGLYKHNTNLNEDQEFVLVKDMRNSIWDLKVINGNLYIASSDGLYIVKGKEIVKISQSVINSILYDEKEQIIIAAGANGIEIFDPLKNKVIYKKEIGINTAYGIEKSHEESNNKHQVYWIGTSGIGALRLEKNSKNEFTIDLYDEMDGLENDKLTIPLRFENKVVFGSSNGLLRFVTSEELKASLEEDETYDEDLLRGYFDVFLINDTTALDGHIFNIVDSEDKLWVAKEDKLSYFDKKNHYERVNRPFWGIDYGRINKLYLEEDGTLWVGTAEGLVRYKENDIKEYNSEFKTLIRSVSIAGDSIIFNGNFYDFKNDKNLNEQPEQMVQEVPYFNNAIKITFSATHFEDEHLPIFSFYLEGYDKGWQNYTSQTEVNYTNLHEGTYTFKVKSKNIYGAESEIASYTFVILPPWYRTFWAYAIYFITLVLVVFIAVKLASKRLKAQNAKLEQMVQERTTEISKKNVELEHQKNEILQQKTEIEDSINYAQRIQKAILPLEDEMKSNLKDVFVLFMPKDIVSGDFYWYAKVGDEQVIVCADCTGHGVPGAFMSMIGSDKLNLIVKQQNITDPSLILAEVNKGIKSALKQSEDGSDSTRDGMDVSICTLNLKTMKLRYSGANRALWILRDNEIEEIKPTKVALGGHTPINQKFELHEITVNINDQIYMHSDGYADQFGGDDSKAGGKKLKVKSLKKFIVDDSNLSMQEQRDALEKAFYEWKGELEQVDDVCIIGIRL